MNNFVYGCGYTVKFLLYHLVATASAGWELRVGAQGLVVRYRRRSRVEDFHGAGNLWTSRTFVIFDIFPVFSETSMLVTKSIHLQNTTPCEDSMNAAVHEAVIANDNNSNIAVAVDGTWHKRGYSSLNGVVCATSVENGKWGNGMSGVLSIFQRSETSRKACYTQYLGDGDSKGFLTIKEAKVYGDTEVEKLECVGHVQKRMGTRLRNILKMSKGIKLSDGKNISGRGRLTLKEVDSIQHYYGLAIRKNLSSVEDMKRAIWAIYFHKLSTEDNPQHALCPLGEDSWCGYNLKHWVEFYIHKHSLPESILLKVKKKVFVGSHRRTY
ncbi:uncharacterized protein TNCV_4666371 [Trichonephila clavipes]|nr:uncharacterized protein TNCV_4666371 [Trichonephila clavipes]